VSSQDIRVTVPFEQNRDERIATFSGWCRMVKPHQMRVDCRHARKPPAFLTSLEAGAGRAFAPAR